MIKMYLRNLLFALHGVKRWLFPNLYLGKVPVVKSIRKRLLLLIRADFVENVRGHRMYLDPADSLLLSWYHAYEMDETRVLEDLLRPGDVAVDVGANIGYYTLIFARQVGPSGHVFSFEPEPQNFRLLCKNIEINAYRNVTPINKAVYDSQTQLNLYVCSANRGCHSVYDRGDGGESIAIEAVRLDDFFADFEKPIRLVKMDIQGAEFMALKGCRNLIARNPTMMLFVEYWPKGLVMCGTNPETFLRTLIDVGFRLYEINPKRHHLQETTIAYLLDSYSTGERYTNLLCVRPVRSGH